MFLKSDLSILNVGILKKLSKNVKLLTNLTKQNLFDNFNKYLAVIIIQKYYRRHLYKNAVDHISLEKVTYPCFIFRTKCGKNYFYSYESIVKYIMKTGDTRDPMTRIVYPDEILLRLDSDIKKYLPNIKFKSTLKIKKNPDYARRIRNRENEILSYQTRITEIKDSIIFIIESNMISWNISNILIDNTEYINCNTYINSLLYELKILLRNLNLYDNHSGNIFKTELMSDIQNMESNESKSKIIDSLIEFI
jgi:hypothetical protein